MVWQPGPPPTDLPPSWPGPTGSAAPGDRFFAAPPPEIGEVTYAATELGAGGPRAGWGRPIGLGVAGAVAALVLYTVVVFPLLRDVLPGGGLTVIAFGGAGLAAGVIAGRTLWARPTQCYFVGRDGVGMFQLVRGGVRQIVLPFSAATRMELKVHVNRVKVGGRRVERKLYEPRWLDASGRLLATAWAVETREGWSEAHEAAKAFHSNASGAWQAWQEAQG